MPFVGQFNAGESVRIWDEFVLQDGSPSEADDVHITLLHGDTVLVDEEPMEQSTEYPSLYYYDYDIPADAAEGTVECRAVGTLDGVRCAGNDTFQISNVKDLIRETKIGNQLMEFHPATVQNNVRKVAIGVMDYMTVKTKTDSDADWTAPKSEQNLYMWYNAVGDIDPIKVGENG